jgi:hypothetical protein
MAELNLWFTDEELDALRDRAEAEGRSVRDLAHGAVTAAVSERRRLYDEAAEHVLKAGAELHRRPCDVLTSCFTLPVSRCPTELLNLAKQLRADDVRHLVLPAHEPASVGLRFDVDRAWCDL